MSRSRGLLVLFGFLCASLTASLSPASPVDAGQGDVQLISQTFNIAADGSLTATLALPPKLDSTDLAASDIIVTAYERVYKRETLFQIVHGALPGVDDTVTITPGCCTGPEAGQITVTVPLEVSEVRPDALSIPRSGLYPFTIGVRRDGVVISQILSFFNRLPTADEPTDSTPLPVAVAIGTHSSVHLDSNGTTSLDSTTVAEMTSLTHTLEALAASKFSATVRIAPAALNGLQAFPAVFSPLVAALQMNQVVAEPLWPLDPSTAAAAGQGLLYTSWLRDGQERFASLGVGPAVVTTSSVLIDQKIGADGAALRRLGGAGLMVVTPAIYDSLDGSIKAFSQYKGELVRADLAGGANVDLAVLDQTIADLLAHPLASPELTRIYAVANLLALRQGIEIKGENVARRGVVIGAPDLGVPDSQLLGSITELISQTPGLAAATLDDIALRTDPLVIDDVEKPVTLPRSDGAALSRRIFTQAGLNNDIAAVASMLPDGDQRPVDWHSLVDLLPTSALDDVSANGIVSSVEAEMAAVRGAVQVPAAYVINLAGRRSTVRLRFVNNADVPLKVKVLLTAPSGKLVFANNDEPVVLEPGVPTVVRVDVEARANGTSGVSLDVFTPTDVPLGPTVPLTVRVRALGVGNVVTIVLLLLVLLWWLQHIRSTRRKRRQPAPATLPAS